MRKPLVAVVIAVVVMIGTVGAVSAITPIIGSFDNGSISFVDTEVCAPAPWGFAVNVTEHEYGSFQAFFDEDGDFVKAIVHQNYDAVISANGHTIYERDRWQTIVYPDGSRDVGLTVHIQGPGGIVQLDAGQIVRDADGNILYVVGPHPQALGETTWCFALAP
jgi:hypothetical protein